MSHVFRRGTTSRSILVDVRDEARHGSPATGLSHRTPGATAAYLREGGAGVERIALVPGTLGGYAAGAFVEVDRVLMPGIYQLGVPDAALAPGAGSVVLLLTFPGARMEPVEITLVAYDPQDESRLGMSALGPEGRIAALRGAFPRLTARELDEERATAPDA